MDIRALTMDRGGTVTNWHGGPVAELNRIGAVHERQFDSLQRKVLAGC